MDKIKNNILILQYRLVWISIRRVYKDIVSLRELEILIYSLATIMSFSNILFCYHHYNSLCFRLCVTKDSILCVHDSIPHNCYFSFQANLKLFNVFFSLYNILSLVHIFLFMIFLHPPLFFSLQYKSLCPFPFFCLM